MLTIPCFTGCQSLTTLDHPVAESRENITVQIRAANRKSVNQQITLKPNMRLQDVVNESNVRFRNKTAYIVRTSPSTAQRHKLEAVFGPNKRISLETDYALQPGDRVVIAQDPRTSIERIMMDIFGRS